MPKPQDGPTNCDRLRDILRKNPDIRVVELQDRFPEYSSPNSLRSVLSRLRQQLGISSVRKPGSDWRSEVKDDNKDTLSSYLGDHGITRSELDAVLKSASQTRRRFLNLDLGSTGKFRFLVVSDTHIGHQMFDESTWDLAMKVLKRDNCEFVLHPGDHLEGMSGRPGHVYELSQIGYKEQSARCIELYLQIPKDIPIYGIDGNHDQWFKSKADIGLIVGEELERRLPNFHHLGEWEGTLPVSGVRIMLFHANDGTAYATSYKGQKLVESLDMMKPALIFEGHYHKSLYQYVRRIHQFESGTICNQTGFMRGKKIPAHVGFWRVEVEHHHGKVIGVESKWYCLPKYV